MNIRFITAFLAMILCTAVASIVNAAEPLPSWNQGPARAALIQFVSSSTTKDSPNFVQPANRIAVFDNDGTLWSEQPMYFQLAFAIDRVKALAPQHPEWKEKEPFRSLLKGDTKSALAGGEKAIMEILAATHTGMTTDEFAEAVRQWIDTARHPKSGRLYKEMVFQPMLEVLAYLRENGYQTYIVSGGGIEFMRVFAEEVYGIPPYQVIGSSSKLKYEAPSGGGEPAIRRLAEINFVDDKEGKPVGIHQHIGKRPLMAFGNSDGDFQMLEWTTTAPGPRFGLIVHHTDAEREWAYDRDSHIGKLDRGLSEAPARGWIVVDMAKDWKTIYPSGTTTAP